MSDRFANLTAACGGSLNSETLRRFQIAMREYELFMSELERMMAPVNASKEQAR